jgi:hypothetical protein
MCTSAQYAGNSGVINVDVNEKGYLVWAVYMYNPALRGGWWAYREYVAGQPVSGEPLKSRSVLHGSVNPAKLKSGAIFQLAVNYVDPLGFTHTSVPNACVIP